MASALILLKITSLFSAGCSISAAMMGFNVGQTQPNLEDYTIISPLSFNQNPDSKIVLKYRGVEYQRALH